MVTFLSNIRESYKNIYTQLVDAKDSAQKIFDDTSTEQDVVRVTSIAFKALGTFFLSFIAINVLSALSSRSFSILKFTFYGLFFVIGHDFLKTGDNLHKLVKRKIPIYQEEVIARGLQEEGKGEWEKFQRMRRQEGLFAAIRQGATSLRTLVNSGEEAFAGDGQKKAELFGRGISQMACENTIVFKRIFDWALSQKAEE